MIMVCRTQYVPPAVVGAVAARVAGGRSDVAVTAPVTAVVAGGGEVVANGFGGEEEGVGEVFGDDVGGAVYIKVNSCVVILKSKCECTVCQYSVRSQR